MFNLMELINMSEEKFIKNMNLPIILVVKKTGRKALYKMLVDIEKIDSSIPYNNYYLNYFE